MLDDTLARLDAGEFLDQAIPLLRQVILRQMKSNTAEPDSISSATQRGREATTLAALVRTLERLDALDNAREKKAPKKTRPDAELKQRFVRRLDQLLAAGPTGGGAEESEQR